MSQKKIEKKFDKWKIILFANIESIVISIEQNNENLYYQSFYSLKFLQTFKFFESKKSINEIMDFISNLLDQNLLKLNEIGGKLIIYFDENTKLILSKKENLSKETNEIKIEELIQINSIQSHSSWIRSLSIFPSGNIISVSNDQSINIYDNNLKIIQIILKAHDHIIYNVCVKDNNNFVTCSLDENIKTWIKKNSNEKFTLNQIIYNAHSGWIYKVIYSLKGNLISCSFDETIKIWEENNNKYQSISIFKHSNEISSILLLEDKNILISSSLDGTKLWNFNNCELLSFIKAIGNGNNILDRIDDDRIINGGFNGYIYIISISKKKVIHGIRNGFRCCGVCVFKNRGIFFIAGDSKDIKIYRNDNYECIKIYNYAHSDNIYGLTKLSDNTLASYGCDKIIKIWYF